MEISLTSDWALTRYHVMNDDSRAHTCLRRHEKFGFVVWSWPYLNDNFIYLNIRWVLKDIVSWNCSGRLVATALWRCCDVCPSSQCPQQLWSSSQWCKLRVCWHNRQVDWIVTNERPAHANDQRLLSKSCFYKSHGSDRGNLPGCIFHSWSVFWSAGTFV